MKQHLVLIFLLTGSMIQAQPFVDTIEPANDKLQLDYLAAGTRYYKVGLEKHDRTTTDTGRCKRTITREEWNGKTVIVVRQNWFGNDGGGIEKEVMSIADPGSFTPLYHVANSSKTGRIAYRFTGNSISMDDTVHGLQQPGFRKVLDAPAFNKEMDLEIFSLLPLAEGKAYVIRFYQPGDKSSLADQRFIVMGSETISGPGGQQVGCFLLYTEANDKSARCTWWISKTKHEVIKMEDLTRLGKRYMILIGE